MRRFISIVVVAIIALMIGFAAGSWRASRTSETNLDQLVAMSWGDGKYGPAFYGAQVYLRPIANGYSVRARVHLGRGNDHFHDCGELGTVRTPVQAVAQWGTSSGARMGFTSAGMGIIIFCLGHS